MAQPVAIAIHGGAGNITPQNLSPDKQSRVEKILSEIVERGYERLRQGASALDVVEEAVRSLEESGYFNAGLGAVPNQEGIVELDAAIMDGKTLRAGAIAAARLPKYPISAARKVMEETPHVLVVGAGADALVRKWQLEERGQVPLSEPLWTYGTVGAVALDKAGNLASATSTGGIGGKMPGRVGDSPLIGAGTYAENGVGALSATGKGEYFIRIACTYDVIARIKYGKEAPPDALQNALNRIAQLGGEGGCILVTPRGETFMLFNSSGMYRAAIDANGKKTIDCFK
ncbi:MAG: isoaspartyl peptidase/L-asparaginase family protein [Bacteroidia bacterium]